MMTRNMAHARNKVLAKVILMTASGIYYVYMNSFLLCHIPLLPVIFLDNISYMVFFSRVIQKYLEYMNKKYIYTSM